ncbi:MULTISPECIES: type I methionyl aminopeptidase [unclassified Paenibacillus]|uniref:type I methionyl aminopeptidase n=1 Tax=unclassified Paenibacillus TaxID=185978 RepID=UPI001C0F9D08|nr:MULTISPECIES: type I methionyl aminopeptidase [unclassified Paenibacillus]MBU5442615.1 type I methionyl aminopeptidase [Paenibacillus sp. MSJ-34]CAH0119069.1 Methionine aminopeptidase 1 [Paenibacillus sp. CECT 9249]
MVVLKSPAEIEQMKKAGQIVAACHREIAKMIKPGVSTLEINDMVAGLITQLGGKQFTKGYKGYPSETCASVNDVIAHGFPDKKPLQDGDIVTIDVVVEADGWFGDSGWTYLVGNVSDEARRLVEVTKECLYLGIEQAVPGNRIGDVMHAVQQHAEKNGYSVVRDLLAHGVGRSLHEEPNMVHVGKPGRGFRLKEGMVFTIEPMINQGTYDIFIDDDGWTARTFDGKLSAQFEHTIAITQDGPVILTAQ